MNVVPVLPPNSIRKFIRKIKDTKFQIFYAKYNKIN